MDGLDGLVAGCMAVAIAAPWPLWALVGSLLGFQLWNWAPPRCSWAVWAALLADLIPEWGQLQSSVSGMMPLGSRRSSAWIKEPLPIGPFQAGSPRSTACEGTHRGVGVQWIHMGHLLPELTGCPAHRVLHAVVLGDVAPAAAAALRAEQLLQDRP